LRFRFSSSAFFEIPAFIISHAAPDARAISSSTCGSIGNLFLRGSASVRMRSEVQLPPPTIGYVGIELGRGKIGMSEHFLNGTQVGASFEQVGRKRVAQEVGVDPLRVQPGFLGELAQDQERPRPCERPAPGVQEELGPVAGVEKRASAREVAAEGLGGVPADRHGAFLAAFADHSNEAVVEIDPGLLEPHRLGDAEARAVEQLEERLIAERSRLRAGGRVDQPLCLAR
jgi:hypothetical protein